MTKLLACMAALLSLLLLSSCVTQTLFFTESDIGTSLNLINNPGFAPNSLDPAKSLKHWSLHTEPALADSSPVIIDPKNFQDGNTSLRIDASNRSVMIISDPFPVRRYGGYYLRSWLRTDSPNPPNVYLRFIVFREDGKIVNKFRSKNSIQADWSLATLSAGFIRPGARFGRLAIMIPPFKEGSVWVDNSGCFEVHGFKID